MLLIGIRNSSVQTTDVNELVDIGDVYRRYCRRTRNGLPTFVNNGDSLTLNGQGIYHITATLVGSGDVAGDVKLQLLENGQAVDGVYSTHTITTAETEKRTFVIDYYTLVNDDCVLGCPSTDTKTIALKNIGVGATFETVELKAEKVV